VGTRNTGGSSKPMKVVFDYVLKLARDFNTWLAELVYKSLLESFDIIDSVNYIDESQVHRP
jgi:hypothetical protein